MTNFLDENISADHQRIDDIDEAEPKEETWFDLESDRQDDPPKNDEKN